MINTNILSQLEISLVINLSNIFKNGKLLQPEEIFKWDGWKGRKDIISTDDEIPKNNEFKFQSINFNLNNIIEKLIFNKKVVEKRIIEYKDNRKRNHQKIQYRLIQGRKGFIKLFPFIYKNNLFNIFFNSDYFVKNKIEIMKFLIDFYNFIQNKKFTNQPRNGIKILDSISFSRRYGEKDLPRLIIALSDLIYLYITNKNKFVKSLNQTNDDIIKISYKDPFGDNIYQKMSYMDLMIVSLSIQKIVKNNLEPNKSWDNIKEDFLKSLTWDLLHLMSNLKLDEDYIKKVPKNIQLKGVENK